MSNREKSRPAKTPPPGVITAIIADDHPIVRSGLRRLLESSEIRVLAEVGSAEDAITATMRDRPDVLLLDVRLGEDDGFSVLELLRRDAPEVATVILSAFPETTYIARACVLGAAEYLLKDCSSAELGEAVHRVTRREPTPASSLLGTMRTQLDQVPLERSQHSELSPREAQVLQHLGLGLSNREIGLSLDISIDTVKEHVHKAMRKLSLRDRTEAAVWVVKQGWIAVPRPATPQNRPPSAPPITP